MSQRALIARLAKQKGLVIVSPQALELRRQRCGKGFVFVTPSGRFLRDPAEIARLRSLAVPPAYVNVRTLIASAAALRALARTSPAKSAAKRRRQVRDTVLEIAGELANTPTVCRTSYVHDAVIAAFEAGALKRVAKKRGRSPVAHADALARVIAKHTT